MRWATVLIVGVIVAGEVRADRAPPAPLALAQPVHVIYCGTQMREFVAVVIRDTATTATFVEFDPDNPIVIIPFRRKKPELLIVPRAAVSAYPSATEVAVAVHKGCIPGASQHTLDSLLLVPAWHVGTILIEYGVRPNESGEGLQLVQYNWKHPLYQLYLVVGFLTVALILSGVWLIHRKRRAALAAK
ncbi:MAG: hypothetical protein U0792_19515 [Gemmataceae bacterium]